MASLRILQIAHAFPPESVGGVEQHTEGLTRALTQLGHEVSVYTRTTRAGPQGELVREQQGALPVTRVIYRHEGLRSLQDLYRCELLDASFRRFASGTRFDVAHVHHLTGLSMGVLEVLRELRIPTVMTLHDYFLVCARGQMFHRLGQVCTTLDLARCTDCLRPTHPPWFPPERGTEPIQHQHALVRDSLALPQQLIVPSVRTISPFLELGLPRERFRVIENGVDTEALLQLPPARRMPGPLRIGYLGTVIPSKGLDVLVDAVAQLPGLVRLEIHGNAVNYHGDEGFLTRVFSRLSPTDQVRYMGPYRTQDLPRIFAGIDVLVVPALWHEAFGLTLREALAAGRPVIASRVGGLQDGVRSEIDGFLVEPGDRAALVHCLTRLAKEPGLLEKMSARTREHARSFATMAQELLTLYQSIVELDPGQRGA